MSFQIVSSGNDKAIADKESRSVTPGQWASRRLAFGNKADCGITEYIDRMIEA